MLITIPKAILFLSGNMLIGLSILLSMNIKTILYGFLCMPLVCLYPLAKRVTYYPQIFLSLPTSFGSLMGYTSITNNFGLKTTLPLFLGSCAWVYLNSKK